MWIIAKLTCREMLLRRVFHIAFLLTLAYLALYGTALHYAYRSPVHDVFVRNIMATQLTSMGLYLSSFIVAFLAVLGSVGAIAAEVESGVIMTLLVKPVRRRDYVLGKFSGLAMMLLAYSALFFLAVIMLNVFFSSGLVQINVLNIAKAGLFYLSVPLIILSISLWGSSFLPTLNNGVVAVILYSAATIGGIIEQVGHLAKQAALVNIGVVTSLLLPVDAMYRKALNTLFAGAPGDFTLFFDSFFTGKYEPSIWMTLYAVLYMGFFLWRAVAVFGKRDL